jgi:queuine/archaeosine tRNA-ribosyltransferase
MKLNIVTFLLTMLFLTATATKSEAQDGRVWPRFGRSYTVYAPETDSKGHDGQCYCATCRRHLRKYYRHRYWEDRYWENRNYHDEYYYEKYGRSDRAEHASHYYEMVNRHGRDYDRWYRTNKYYYRGGGY